MSTEYQIHGETAVIVLNNPPVNGLGHATRKGIQDGLEKALADPAVTAIVLTGAGKAFSGGADIREFNTPQASAQPGIATVIATIESATKPVIAAMNALAMGGGLELALGCHYRVTTPDTEVALPEVNLGIIPGAGGTQRLPRLVGVETALNMIVNGETVKAKQLASTRLFDEIVDGDLMQSALQFARLVAALGVPLPRVRDITLEYPHQEAYFKFARNTIGPRSPNFPAPLKSVDAIQKSVTEKFDDGLRAEREIALELVNTVESKALRHAFFGERAASKIPDVPADTTVRRVRSVAVIGAGTMGTGIAVNFLNAGIPVHLVESRQEALDRGMDAIRKIYEVSVQKGKLAQAKLEERIGLVRTSLSYDDIKDADLVIEAVFEDMDVKESVFRKLDEVMKPGAILATNTSTLDVNRIASCTSRPQDVIGMHFFSPAHVMKLLEVVRGDKTARDVLATVMKLAGTIRKKAVVSGVCDGFIGNRMLQQYTRQAGLLLDEGCLPEQIDKAIERFGFAMGPFRMSDLAGNDISWAIRKRRAAQNPGMVYSKTADLLCEMGRYGQKTSAGWYDYQAGDRKPQPSKVVKDMIERHSRDVGLERRKVSDVEIVERLVYSLTNEGARILEEGIAAKASDIDVVFLTGYGFPLHRGGPMFYADHVGLPNVVAAIGRFSDQRHGELWKVAPLLEKLAGQPGGFTSLRK